VKPTAVFVFNLVQDVNILRPIAVIASRDFGFETQFLISSKFSPRDLTGVWIRELEELASWIGASTTIFDSECEAFCALDSHGVIFAASETHLPNHGTVHEVFRSCPASYLKVTVQHGFECVGYLHSADHMRAHGDTASFGADFVCAWSETALASMSPSQRAKLVVTGPSSILQQAQSDISRAGTSGIICENLHSVRFRGPGERIQEFVHAFDDFCRQMTSSSVALRPHPGGQYVLKNKVAIPSNAYLENSPVYRLDLRQFRYGISAPSSVLIDMLLADIPTAVWRDGGGAMDSGNYAGLPTVGSPKEWAVFAKSAIADPKPFLEQQREFIARTGIITDPATVYSRFAAIFDVVARREQRPLGALAQRHRIQFVSNSRVPTLQLSFEKPLAGPIARGEVYSDLLTEGEIRAIPGRADDAAAVTKWIQARFDNTQPTALIFCRYSGPAPEPMVELAKARRIPVIYHIDDDLLAIPRDIGERKFALHNAPERLATVRYLLQSADLVYCSTQRLKDRLLGYFPGLNAISGKIYCSGTILSRPAPGGEIVIGYMASADHAHNLDMVLPAIERVMDLHVNVRFELFGSIRVPAALQRFGGRVSNAPPVADYSRFLDEFAARKWDIGVCPLVPIDFNLMKANTKWVEYSSAGIAVVASRGTVYDECCSDGCGILADGPDQWFEALDLLVRDEKVRLAQVARAQSRLVNDYSLQRLREQVFDVIATANDQAIQLTPSENLEMVNS
jgi:hypothetical protein